MDVWGWLDGLICLKVTGADIASSMTLVNQAGFHIYQSEVVDELNMEITVRRKDLHHIRERLDQKGDAIEVIGHKGFYWRLFSCKRRPVLVLGILVLLFLNLYLPRRILFVQVEGNSLIETRHILYKAAECGLRFGADRREIRSEKIKNQLLEQIPQLQWCGVNTSGCVATVSVTERSEMPLAQEAPSVSSIVAARDGIIYDYTVTKGNPVCKIGQAVKAGEVLISGYTDCGISIQATKAEGEVYAKTERVFSVVMPSNWEARGSEAHKIKKYSLIIGKKRINLNNHSGILYPTCGKMYKEICISLPGGFILPIAFAVETLLFYECVETQVESHQANRELSQFARDYLSKKMIAGKILSAKEAFTQSGSLYELTGRYACTEMIGKVRKEEIYGKHH